MATANLNALTAEFKNGDITGFEVLSVSDSLKADINMDDFAGIDHLTLAGISTDVTVSSMQSGSTLKLGVCSYTNKLTVKGDAAGQDDVLNIELTYGASPASANVSVQDV